MNISVFSISRETKILWIDQIAANEVNLKRERDTNTTSNESLRDLQGVNPIKQFV